MEALNLFAQEEAQEETKTKTIRLVSIRAVFKKEVVREAAPTWLSARCADAGKVFELFRDLSRETKEHFVALHLDNKNRIVCYDTVSIGSLSASIVHPREVYKPACCLPLRPSSSCIITHREIRRPAGKTWRLPRGSRRPESCSASGSSIT